jgi:hypothetical protein
MEITTFIAQFMGWFLVVVGAAMLLKRATVENAMRNAAKNRGTMFVVGLVQVGVGILLVLSHSSWVTLLDKTVSVLSWFILLEGVFYLIAKERQIMKMLRFTHTESVYYTVSFAFVVVGVAMLMGA